jgi:PAS domain S-box-containing protein
MHWQWHLVAFLLHTNMLHTAQFFDSIYNNARQNAILLLNEEGMVLGVNRAFTTAYGYTAEDLHAVHFRILFLEKDQATRRPDIELSTVLREGSSSDENYLVHKDGTPIWITGESILVKTEDTVMIVKIIHNIHAQKQLERYLLASSELLDSLFDSVQQSGLLLLNNQTKTIKANAAFKKMFALETPVTEGGRLQQMGDFWSGDEIRNDIRNAIVTNTAINKEYILNEAPPRRLHISSKLIVSEASMEKKLLLMIKEG